MDERISSACEEWLESLTEGWWDDAADGGGFLSSMEEAFIAGWNAALATVTSPGESRTT